MVRTSLDFHASRGETGSGNLNAFFIVVGIFDSETSGSDRKVERWCYAEGAFAGLTV